LIEVRHVELLGALSLATDLGTGQPLEHGLQTCVLATELARSMALGPESVADACVTALLHSIGCTSDAYEASIRFGDDVALRAAWATVDPGQPREVLAFIAREAGRGQPALRRGATFARVLAEGPAGPRSRFRAHCEVGRRLAERLALSAGCRRALGFVFERWDGKGYPAAVAASGVPVEARVLHVARDVLVLARRDGGPGALKTMAARAGAAYDPDVVAVLSDPLLERALMAGWEEVTAFDAVPASILGPEALERALGAMADFADIKSPWLLGNSHRVAELAEAAAWRLSLAGDEVAAVRSAALVRDLGRVAIANEIWDKPAALSGAERERVRLHPYFTERALSRVTALAEIAALASSHHERVGGGGYHRGVDAAAVPVGARVLAAADAYVGMTSRRPHRRALDAVAAASELRAMALDRACVEAVLAAAGHPAQRVPRALPAGLSEREVEVLTLLARGKSNKQIGAALGIAPKTVGHHVGHVYGKIGVSTRAAAALFAVEHDLLRR
jgi:HD-GYP domain-containing protein (c-di-GMP phosphodiesterase class II)